MKNYSNRETRKLVEEYEELKHLKGTDSDGRIYHLIRLADLSVALRHLKRTRKLEYEAVLLCGLNSLTTRTAGVLVGTSNETMNKRYKRGLESLARYLNHAVQR